MAYEVEQVQDSLERLAVETGARWAPEPPFSDLYSLQQALPQQQPARNLQSIFLQPNQGEIYSVAPGLNLGSGPGEGRDPGQQQHASGGGGAVGLTSRPRSSTGETNPGGYRSTPTSGAPQPQEMQLYGYGQVSGAGSAMPGTGIAASSGPVPPSMFGRSLLGGPLGPDWDPLVGGATQQAPLDFGNMLGPLTAAANAELGSLALTRDCTGEETWGPGLQGPGPDTAPSALGLSNEQSGMGAFSDWRAPGSIRRAELDFVYSRQTPQGPSLSLDPHMMFHDKMYLNCGPDPGQPSLQYEAWLRSNGNVSNGLDALTGDCTFWSAPTAGHHNSQRSQGSSLLQNQLPYSQGRAQAQAVSSSSHKGQPSQSQYSVQYTQANQNSGPVQQQRSQRSKREHRRSSGGGGPGRGGGGRGYGQPGRNANRRSNPVAAPPSWADASWHPRKAVASGKVGQTTGGTGVFLPGAQKAVVQHAPIPSALPDNPRGKQRGNAQYLRPQPRERVGLLCW